MRPDSVIGKALEESKSTIATNNPILDKADQYGSLLSQGPRLRPTDLPGALVPRSQADIVEGTGEPALQNQTARGQAYETLEPKFKYPLLAGKKLLKEEMLLRKGVDVDSNSLYPDSATKDSLKRAYQGGQWANPGRFEQLQQGMENRMNSLSDEMFIQGMARKKERIL